MFFEFLRETKGDVANYVDDGGWPCLIDEFVLYFNDQKSKGH